MGKYYFSSLQILHQDMKNKNESRATFPFDYNEKTFSCIFLSDITPYRLYLTTLGENPYTFELEIDTDYAVRGYMEDYKVLVEYLEIKYDPNHIFKPTDFFEALNNKIPKLFKNKPNYNDVLGIISRCRKIEEADKLYFCGWYKNPIGKNARPENIEKTRSSFGDDIANMSRIKNISSCWTDQINDETIKKLNEIISM